MKLSRRAVFIALVVTEVQSGVGVNAFLAPRRQAVDGRPSFARRLAQSAPESSGGKWLNDEDMFWFSDVNTVVADSINAMRRATTVAALSATLFLAPSIPLGGLSIDTPNSVQIPFAHRASSILSCFHPAIASAADYGSLSEEQKAVAEAWRLVDNSYIDRTFNNQDWFKLRQDNVKRKYKNMDEARQAIDSFVSSLGDKYTRYLTPAKYDSIVNAATGNLFGVGVELSMTKDGGRVMASGVEPNSPASTAGIQPNDIFLEVDGTRFDDGKATPDDVASKVRGPEGSKVGIVMERDGKVIDFIITRQPIKITTVKSYLSDKGGVGKVGVVRIKNFSGTTASTVKEELEALQKKGAEAFVLDVRGNPGGLLPGGVDTASLFLGQGRSIVFVANKNGVVDAQETLADGPYLESPLVVYVNGNTASAAEVMTAALKENGRATVCGEQTFGKGIVQTIRQLSNNNGGVAVTVARYETPQHRDINKQGIAVDVPVSPDCEKDDVVSCLPASAFKKPKL